jgi:RNA polymerase sigma factor (sigma-70 family)
MSWHGIHQMIVRAKAGDDDAWTSLHDMVRPYLVNEAQRVLGPNWAQQSASDLTQDTWQRAWTRIEGFRGGDSDEQTAALFRAWLRQTLRRIHSNHERAERAQRRLRPPGTFSMNDPGSSDRSDGRPGFEAIAEQSSVSARLRRDEQKARIEQALSKFGDPEDRELVRLYFFEGHSIRQIAQDRGVSPHTIGSELQRILGRMEPDLKDL